MKGNTRCIHTVHAIVIFCLAVAPVLATDIPLPYQVSGASPLCISPANAIGGEAEVLAGYSNGDVVCLNFTDSGPQVTWKAQLDGEVLAAIEKASSSVKQRDIVAATSIGQVVCFHQNTSTPAWTFKSTCEVSALAEFVDIDHDGVTDVLVGGSDHRVHLLSGKTGETIWSHFFRCESGTTYISRLLVTQDTNTDKVPDVAVWLWSGELAVLSGKTGERVWIQQVGGGMTDGLAVAPDLNGDGLAELVIGDNSCAIKACSGRDGFVLWSGPTARPIRDVAVCPSYPQSIQQDGDADSTRRDVTAFACTAGGDVICYRIRTKDTNPKPTWIANLGGVCRSVTVTVDLDNDNVPDVLAGSESGIAAIISGKTGTIMRRWMMDDEVRQVCSLNIGGEPYVAMAGLDGSILLSPVIPDNNEATVIVAALTGRLSRPQYVPQSRRPTIPISTAEADENSGQPRVIILLYHDVLPEAINHYSTSVETFETHMDMLLEEGYTCVSLDQIADWIDGKGGMPPRAVCITFDGQYRGQYTYALPILKQRGLFATSYITTDWIGTANHSDWRQIREMESSGLMDTQNHSVNHPYFTRVGHREVVRQVADSNNAIAKHMGGKTCLHHAYPAGAYNKEICNTMQEQGFRTATTVRPGPVHQTDNPMALPRYMLCTHKTPEIFRSWLTDQSDR